MQTVKRRVWIGLGFTAGLALALCGCGGKPSAVSASGGSGSLASAGGQPPAQDPRDLPVPKIDGKPMWAANRKHTAEENAQYQYDRNGADFGARSESDYVTKAHAFLEKPPRDAQSIDRPNGDRLIYDPGGNVFVVVARNGAPRTMFKPRDGASYWDQQKSREAKRVAGGQNGGGSDQS